MIPRWTSHTDIPAHGRCVHLKEFGFIEVFRTVAPNGDVEHWATSNLEMEEITHQNLARQVSAIESYHRQLKQCCGMQYRAGAGAKRKVSEVLHPAVFAAFVRLEAHRLRTASVATPPKWAAFERRSTCMSGGQASR